MRTLGAPFSTPSRPRLVLSLRKRAIRDCSGNSSYQKTLAVEIGNFRISHLFYLLFTHQMYNTIPPMFVSLSYCYIPKISATLYKYGGVYLASLSVIASVKIFSSCFFSFLWKSQNEKFYYHEPHICFPLYYLLFFSDVNFFFDRFLFVKCFTMITLLTFLLPILLHECNVIGNVTAASNSK